MHHVDELTSFLNKFAPTALAEPWDNVGLLLGDRAAPVAKVLTCLTLTPDVAAEAIREQAGLIVTHHPVLFRAVKRITTDDVEGAMLLSLIKADVAVYSPHTAFDSAEKGINQRLAAKLGLSDIRPLRPIDTDQLATSGGGRVGTCSETDFATFADRVCAAFNMNGLEAVATTRPVQRVAVACGSAAEYLPDAYRSGCDVLVTGEARFHAALEARSLGIGLLLLGHYTSERFAVEELALLLGQQFPSLTIWPSRDERDPLQRF